MSSMFRKKATSKRSVDAYSDSDGSVSDAPTTALSTTSRATTIPAEPIKRRSPPPPVKPPPKRQAMSSELWTVLIGILIGVIGRAAYAKFGGIDLHTGQNDEVNDSLWASLLRDLDAQVNEFSSLKAVVAAVSSLGNLSGVQEGTVGAVIIGVWEGVLLHQVLRLSARAAAGVFAGLAGRLILDLISAPPGQAARFTASLLGISLGMLLSEVVRGVFDEKDHWEDRTVTHYHKSSHRLRKSSAGRRRRTTSGELIDDPDATDDPRSVAASATTMNTERSRRHRRSLSDPHSRSETIVRGASPLPSVLTGDLEAEIADLRLQASAAAGQQRKYQEEQRYEYAQGNGARALQLAWEVKRYEALAESLTRQVGDRIVEAHRRAVEKELAAPLPAIRPAPPTTAHRTGMAHRPGGYYSENDALRNPNPVRVTVSAGGETYEVTANDEEVEIGPNLRVRTRHVYQPSTAPQPPPQPASVPNRSGTTAVPTYTSARSTPARPAAATPSPSATPSPGHGRPPRSVPRSKLSNFAQSVGGTDEDMRSISVGSKARTRSRRGGSD